MTLRRFAVAGLLGLALAGCADAPEVDRLDNSGPEAAALSLFTLAGEFEPDETWLARLLDPATLEADRAAALDTLTGLRPVSAATVVQSTELQALGRVVLDLDGELPGGVARYSVQVESRREAGWQIVSILGPGVEWPARATPREEGLSSSAPPDAGS
jgi:hypothetical protein